MFNNENKDNELNLKMMQIYKDLTFKPAKEIDVKRENANIDGDTAMGTMLKYGSEGAKEFNLNYVIDPKQAQAHINGDIHIHDLDFYTLTTTCCQIDLIKLFKGGFSTGHGYLREPNDILSYAALACIAIQSNQNDQHGGQSIPNFDYGLAEGVKKTYKKKYLENLAKSIYNKFYNTLNKHDVSYNDILEMVKLTSEDIYRTDNLVPTMNDDMTYHGYLFREFRNLIEHQDELHIKLDTDLADIQENAVKISIAETDRNTYQAMEALIHNLNTMNSRAGAQVPFSSINYGTDTSLEGRMVIKNILLATEAGLGDASTPIFPVQIFKVKEGVNFNKEDPNYDMFKLAMRTSAKRMFPNFSFIDAPFNLKYYKPNDYNTEIAYMGCRTRVMANIYDKSNEIVTSRGNLSFTTINLPRLGIEAKGNLNKFYHDLDEMMELVFQQLLDRFKIQSSKKVKNYPFLMGQGVWLGSENLSENDTVGEILKHGTLSCGFIGLAECLVALTGKHHGEDEESQKLGLEIIGHMRKKTDEQCEKTGLNFTLLATPAEGLSGRFIKIDKEKYGIIEGITDKDYYTNSFHIPVYYNITIMKKIRLEAPYHELTNAGHISYIELDCDPLMNLNAFETIVRYMKENNIGYGAINHPIDRDPCCGYNGIIYNECPKCHRQEREFIIDRVKRPSEFLK